MKRKYQHSILQLTVLSLIAGGVYLLLQTLLAPGILTPALPWLILLFFLVTAAVHFFLLKITTMNPRKFVGYFMLSTFFKLFIYLIVMITYVFYVKEGILAFVLAFFTLYIIYTVYEVVTILKQTKELS